MKLLVLAVLATTLSAASLSPWGANYTITGSLPPGLGSEPFTITFTLASAYVCSQAGCSYNPGPQTPILVMGPQSFYGLLYQDAADFLFLNYGAYDFLSISFSGIPGLQCCPMLTSQSLLAGDRDHPMLRLGDLGTAQMQFGLGYTEYLTKGAISATLFAPEPATGEYILYAMFITLFIISCAKLVKLK